MNATSTSTGLHYWMQRVLEECDNVAADFSADPVHDLRVSLRRCRSMADGMIAMDPDRNWKAMKKAGKQLFQSLGSLRDVQIMMDWLEKLDLLHQNVKQQDIDAKSVEPARVERARVERAPTPASSQEQESENNEALTHHNSPAHALHHILKSRESDHKQQARAALDKFDRKQWKQWSQVLPQRAARIRPGAAVFKHLALERWTAARELHVRAMRTRSKIALHTLRIGIKRFRYIVENFLPVEHKLWSNDLKHMQDLLGDVHDLDVLWATALECHVCPDEPSRKSWHARIEEERAKRVEEYRAKTTGPHSLWLTWRAGLPQGKQIHDIATQRMKLWAKVLDPDFAHSERVARLSLQLYDGLNAAGLLNSRSSPSSADIKDPADTREALYAAALLHDVGLSEGSSKHHKESMELIKKHGTPFGWKQHTMAQAALVARFHCKALPTRSHKLLRDLLPDDQREVIRLSAILRLANALDHDHDGHVHRVKIENPDTTKRRTNGFLRKPTPLAKNEAVVIAAEGYTEGSATAQAVAAERYLLETLLRRAIIVRPAQPLRSIAPPKIAR
jgi:CHAD domain-containing protein/HD superfamily phosphodiesterase